MITFNPTKVTSYHTSVPFAIKQNLLLLLVN